MGIVGVSLTRRGGETGKQWERAGQLLACMAEVGATPNAVSYAVLLGAAGRAREWDYALDLWARMGEKEVSVPHALPLLGALP